MKNNKGLIIFIISLLSIVSIGLIVFLVFAIRNKGNFNFSFNSGVSNNIIFEEKYDNDFSLVDISSDAANVYIRNTSDEQFRVVIYGEKEDLDVNTNNDKLDIDLKAQKCVGFCFNRKIAKIEVYVPNYYENEFNIENKYGDIFVEEFAKNVFHITENAGDVKVSEALKLYVDNTYGDVEVGTVESSEINLKCGDLEIGTVTELVAVNNYGDIEIKKIKGKFDIKNDCGDIEIDKIDIDSDSSIVSKMGDVEINSTNEIYIKVDHNLGDVDINNNYKNSDITLTINSKLGDVEIRN